MNFMMYLAFPQSTIRFNNEEVLNGKTDYKS
jgi:hypothetical protein